MLVIVYVLIVAAPFDDKGAQNLRSIVGVIFALFLFNLVVTNCWQLAAMGVFTGVSILVILLFTLDPTTTLVINLVLTAITVFVGSGVRTILK